MQQLRFDISHNEPLTRDIFRMWLICRSEAGCRALKSVQAGQFANVSINGCFLRRPISICDIDDRRICFVYKVVGKGTAAMSEMKQGEELDILLPLGTGFNADNAGERPLLVGGGVGVPPLLLLARQLISAGKETTVVLGFNTKQDIILADEFRSMGCNLTIVTVDGSEGQKGFVTNALRLTDAGHNHTYYYACGPVAMLKALQKELGISGELSMEERMGCGFGVCMGCTCNTQDGARQVCTDGPVFDSRQLIL
ncbi:MAG: dihydroorotate dehydrogenase electron transfer subunit [Paludibacteraceae bacterium]|nr:dihydroorotate dehydrogenase electron transfer subunit [Paludibacteraceae bacterium]